ncbi:hypothetical protein EDC04DRAFT_1128140 [Pisolithus marmoratus]|nr:hypothetical protein EDC04DRAFT_1128140 [Pisolithus marmoratus]
MQVTACMHILRSALPPSLVFSHFPPYSSDPFPTTSSAPPDTVQCETRVSVTIRTREDLFTDASRFHLGRHELFTDLFVLAVLGPRPPLWHARRRRIHHFRQCNRLHRIPREREGRF